jgi:hypothetical protein
MLCGGHQSEAAIQLPERVRLRILVRPVSERNRAVRIRVGSVAFAGDDLRAPNKTSLSGQDARGWTIGRSGEKVAFFTLSFHPQRSAEKFLERALRLYEQGRGEPFGSYRLGEYVRRRVP